jgi:hypothetical protein
MMMQRKLCLAVSVGLLAACGGGGTGDPGGGGGGGGPATLPPSATPIAYDTSEVALGQTRETLVSESEPALSAPQDVVYPYDPQNPDANPATPTTVRLRSQCTTRTYDLKSNPSKVVLYSADGNVSYPGALLKGQEFRNGELRRLGVRAEHRTPLTFVINNVYSQSGATSGTVPQPDLQPVQDAIKARIVQAYNDNIPIGDSVAYSYEETNDVQRFMLKARLSARYGGVSGTLGTRIDKQQTQRTVIVNLVQKLYDVEVQQPPTRNDWFNASFFAGGLKPLLDSGEISAANPPVYVSRVSYGRVLTFSLTTTATRSDVEALLRASVRTLVAGGSLALDGKTTNINDSKVVKVASIGGNSAAALAAANSGDWGAFFKERLQLTEAVPIQVEYRNLYDNSPAGVTERANVTEEICTPQIVVPGPYDFALQDMHTRPESVGNINQVVTGDFNGDGRADLVWNELSGNANRFYVGYGTLAGRLRIEALVCGGVACDLSDPNVPWGQFRLLAGDFNGDGRSDLMWLRAGPALDAIEIHALAADPSGPAGQFTGFEATGRRVSARFPLTDAERAGMRPEVIVDDMNNDRREDLVLWFGTRNSIDQNVMDYQVLRGAPAPTADTPFSIVLQPRTRLGAATDRYNTNPATPNYTLVARDINSDGYNDLFWSLRGQDFSSTGPFNDERNVTVWVLNQGVPGDVAFGATSVFTHGTFNAWAAYVPLYGDFDGDGDTDLTWVGVANGGVNAVGAVHQAAYNGTTGTFAQGALQRWETAPSSGNVSVSALLQNRRGLFEVDTNGDAAKDVVVTGYLSVPGQTNFVNGLAVMKGVNRASPMFNVSSGAQQHPVNHDWQNYTFVFVGDFNGDGLQDVLWNNAALDNSVFVAFAKRETEQGTH